MDKNGQNRGGRRIAGVGKKLGRPIHNVTSEDKKKVCSFYLTEEENFKMKALLYYLRSTHQEDNKLHTHLNNLCNHIMKFQDIYADLEAANDTIKTEFSPDENISLNSELNCDYTNVFCLWKLCIFKSIYCKRRFLFLLWRLTPS